jgi:hypothetical protein
MFRLHPDGTPEIDPNTNQYINTYSNEDIMAFARVWTGWNLQPQRSNVMAINEAGTTNMVDPMLLNAKVRDRFPKTKLLGNGHLGDGYPLCSGLPPRHYLKRGATYSYHGPISMFGDLHDNAEKLPNIRDHFVPDADASGLYQVLCGKKEGKCTFPSLVTLEADLVCNGAVECGADLLRAVKIVDGDTWGFYTCVHCACGWRAHPFSSRHSSGVAVRLAISPVSSVHLEEPSCVPLSCLKPTHRVLGCPISVDTELSCICPSLVQLLHGAR